MVADGGLTEIEPDSAGNSPASVRSSVDLPAPFTPTRPTTSPGATTRSRSEKRIRAPWPAASPRATRVALTGTGSQGRRTDFRPGSVVDEMALVVVVRAVVLILVGGVAHIALGRGVAADQPRLEVVVAAHRDPPELADPVAGPVLQLLGQFAVHEQRARTGDRGEPAGQVDHRGEDVAQPGQHRTVGRPHPQRWPFGGIPDDGQLQPYLGSVDRAPGGEQHAVADRLHHPAVVAGDDLCRDAL